MRKKKSPSSKCSAGSEDLGSGLKVWDIYNRRMRKKEDVGTLRPNFTQESRAGFLVLGASGPTTMTNMPAKSTEKDSETRSLSKETFRISDPRTYLSMIFLQRDFPVRLFPLQENARVFRTKQGELFSMKYAELLEVKDQNTYSLRMLKGYFLTIVEEPSRSYSFRWMSLGTMSSGKCLTLSIGCPKTVKGSLSSVLEEKVDEKYHLSKKAMEYFVKKNIENKKAGRGFKANIQKGNKESSTIDARYGALRNTGETYILQIARGKNKGGIKEKISPTLSASVFEHNNLLISGLKQVGNIDKKGHNSLWGRVYDPKGISANINAEAGGLGAKTGLYVANTVDTDGYLRRGTRDRDKNGKAILTSIPKRRIRRLTPRECERLQGFPDDWTRVPAIGNDIGIEIASHPEDEDEIIRGKIMSDTQRYKMMGNAVSVPVIEAIGRKILECIA